MVVPKRAARRRPYNGIPICISLHFDTKLTLEKYHELVSVSENYDKGFCDTFQGGNWNSNDDYSNNKQKTLACAFGTGLAWASVYFETEKIVVSPIIIY